MRVQQSAWGLEGSGGIPAHVLIATQHHSGLVLGAYDGKRMVGILFGFTALDETGPYHYSHITGVARNYQSRGVGFRLKLAQRRHVIRQGQQLVRWTYDPLQASNAYFNIGKIGAVCNTYRRNLYGTIEDSLNRGRITDRFEVEWWVKSSRVRDRILGRWRPLTLDRALSDGAKIVNITERVKPGVRRPVSASLGSSGGLLLVEIPESCESCRGQFEDGEELDLAFSEDLRDLFSEGLRGHRYCSGESWERAKNILPSRTNLQAVEGVLGES